jgi:hypothetical protein
MVTLSISERISREKERCEKIAPSVFTMEGLRPLARVVHQERLGRVPKSIFPAGKKK